MKLVQLNNALSDHQLETLQLVVQVLNVSPIDLDSCKTITDVYRLLEHRILKEVISWLIQVILRIGVPKSQLKNLEPHILEEVHVEENTMVDLILTLADILMNFTDERYSAFKELVIRTHLSNFHSSRLSSRTYLLQVLLERNLILPDKLEYFFAWLEAAGCPNQHKALRKFCERHGIVEPQWEQLVQPISELLQ